MQTVGSFDLSDRVAVITGAGQGIGRTLAQGLADYGAHVAVVDLDLAQAESTVSLLANKGGNRRHLAIQSDVSSQADVTRAFEQVVDTCGSVDVLVNNAGIWSFSDPMDLTLPAWNRTLAVNLTGSFLCAREAAKSMIPRRHGSIINISSVSGVQGFKNRVAYTASKHGVIGITRALANDWAAHNVRVNSIGPGAHLTDMTKEWRAEPEVLEKEFLDKIPMGRMAETSELVGTVIYLASDASSYVTGQTIFSDGGWLLS